MIEQSALVGFVLGDLDPSEEARVLEHVVACTRCASVVARLTGLGSAVAALVRQGGTQLAVTPAMLGELDRAGLLTRSYRLKPGETVACTVDARDVYVVTTLEADLTGVTRVDVVAGPDRYPDVVFDPQAGSVSFVEPADVLRLLPSARLPLELISVEPKGDRTLGEYTLDHTAFSG